MSVAVRPIVAIDGPAGAGKSSVTREVAFRLRYSYIDTGAMYRAVTWLALQSGVPVDSAGGLSAIARSMDLSFNRADQAVLLDGQDVTLAIRQPEVNQRVSAVAGIPQVRQILVEYQRRLGQEGYVVMEGRDIGTVVFPDATVKIFLTASVAHRAHRRYLEMLEHGLDPVSEEVLRREIEERDRYDSTRRADPLQIAPGATVIDTSELSFEETVARVLQECRDHEVYPRLPTGPLVLKPPLLSAES